MSLPHAPIHDDDLGDDEDADILVEMCEEYGEGEGYVRAVEERGALWVAFDVGEDMWEEEMGQAEWEEVLLAAEDAGRRLSAALDERTGSLRASAEQHAASAEARRAELHLQVSEVQVKVCAQ